MKLSEKKLNVKSILLITVILPVFVIVISSVAIYITAKSVQPGSTLDASLLEEKKEEQIPDADEALERFSALINDAVTSGRLKYSKSTTASIDEITCERAEVQEIISFAASSVETKMQEKYEGKTIKYGEDASALISIIPNGIPSGFTAEYTDGKLSLTLEFGSVFGNMYFLGDDKTAISMFIKENESVFSAINEKIVPEGIKYILTADEKTQEIISLSVERTYNYSSHISFKNTLSAIGSMPFGMKITFSENYGFSFAGIRIEEDTVTFSEGGYDTLTVTPFVEENLSENEYSLRFISSDTDVVSVDENGQVTALKESEKPVTVTVELSYLGKVFSDSCEVYVVTPVETVRVSETALNMKKGDVRTITASVTPDDATVKTVDFLSSDKNVVTVNEKGEITAIGAGTATLYAYSVQGLIAAECTVTVTE